MKNRNSNIITTKEQKYKKLDVKEIDVKKYRKKYRSKKYRSKKYRCKKYRSTKKCGSDSKVNNEIRTAFILLCIIIL